MTRQNLSVPPNTPLGRLQDPPGYPEGRTLSVDDGNDNVGVHARQALRFPDTTGPTFEPIMQTWSGF